VPKPTWLERPSSRTPEEREAVFQRYVDATEKYNAAIEDAGQRHRDECPACLEGQACNRVPEPWHGGDIEARRELFNRRYQRPDPPESIPLKTLAQIRRGRSG